MGLCINWTVHAPETVTAEGLTAQLAAWREACLDLPFEEVTDIVHFGEEEIARRLEEGDDEFRWFLVQASAFVTLNRDTPEEFCSSVDPIEVVGFTAWAGEGCEPMNNFLARYPEEAQVRGQGVKLGIREWRGSSFAKTQYASREGAEHFLKCHLTITAALDAAQRLGLLKKVLDEGDYWEHRDTEMLLKTVGKWNGVVAGFVGAMEEAMGQDLPAPIKQHPEFERLEHEGMTSDTAAMAKAIAAALKKAKPEA